MRRGSLSILLAVLVCVLLTTAPSAPAAVPQATLLPGGRAVAPPSAPPAVKAMIEAANREHVFAVIAGLRWDTSVSEDGDRTGPGWSEYLRPTGGFRLRHLLGLLQQG
jgi:hypothetical protein